MNDNIFPIKLFYNKIYLSNWDNSFIDRLTNLNYYLIEKSYQLITNKEDISFFKLKGYKYSITFIDTWILWKKKISILWEYFFSENRVSIKETEPLYQINKKEDTSFLLIEIESLFEIRK